MTAPATALSPPPVEVVQRLVTNVSAVFRGKKEVVELAVTCLLAGGHLLVEDVPGVGKTLLARALAVSIGLDFRRIQFTSDMLPADILGLSIFDQNTGTFQFRPGPIFANVVLADEINRTTPRTQSSLLEAMAEGQISLDDRTHPLPQPFLVIATQNPLESHGTYPLPDSQLDRFLMRVSVGYPELEIERAILMERDLAEPIDSLEPVFQPDDLLALQQAVGAVRIDESLVDYLLAIVDATRKTARLTAGVSTRGALALQRAVRAHALLQGRQWVLPQDVQRLAVPVLAHRVSLGSGESIMGSSRLAAEALMRELISGVDVPV